jgi:NADH dehydrogenase
VRAENGPPAHVVILGGGFGGLYAARALDHPSVRVTLADRRNHHLFQPLLYQVAAAMLNPSDIAAPIRSVLRRQRNAEVLLAEASAIDPRGRRVLFADGGELRYDYLIVATGAAHSYFGHDDWERFAPGLKTIEDALEIRRRVFLAYEAAEREEEPEARREWMTFVIIGGGPTGVELAGALAEIARRGMEREFRRIETSAARVIVIEGLERLLPSYPPSLSQAARRELERRGVEVRTGRQVTGIDERGVEAGGERIPCRSVIWAAGVEASPLARSLGAPLDRAGRVIVEPDLSVPGEPHVFVIGDLARLERDGKPVPGVAPAAIQEGRHAARNILRAVRGEPALPFRYADRGSFATIGRGAAVGEIFGRFRITGMAAWIAWLAIHIFFLIGFRNRFFTLLNWAYHYATFRRGARLITGRGRGDGLAGPAREPGATERRGEQGPA